LVENLRDNTAVNELRTIMVVVGNQFKERMYREVNHVLEVLEDIDVEVQEGMSNRVGDAFKDNEARKYAYRLKTDLLKDALKDLDGIKRDLITRTSMLVGEEYATHDDVPIGGLIGMTTDKNFEQTDLAIRFVNPPEAEIKT